jgi:hypothetical protein
MLNKNALKMILLYNMVLKNTSNKFLNQVFFLKKFKILIFKRKTSKVWIISYILDHLFLQLSLYS